MRLVLLVLALVVAGAIGMSPATTASIAQPTFAAVGSYVTGLGEASAETVAISG